MKASTKRQWTRRVRRRLLEAGGLVVMLLSGLAAFLIWGALLEITANLWGI